MPDRDAEALGRLIYEAMAAMVQPHATKDWEQTEQHTRDFYNAVGAKVAAALARREGK